MIKTIFSFFLALSLSLCPMELSSLKLQDAKQDSLPLESAGISQKPEIHRLPVPLSIQETGWYCVPACLQMVLASHGLSFSQQKLALEMNTRPETGTEYEDLARTVNRILFQCEIPEDHQGGYRIQRFSSQAETMTPEERELFRSRIFQDISTGDPVFAAVNRNVLYPELSAANHMVLIVGYARTADSSQPAFYYLLDPSWQVQDPVFGGLKIISEEELISGILLNEENEKAYIW